MWVLYPSSLGIILSAPQWRVEPRKTSGLDTGGFLFSISVFVPTWLREGVRERNTVLYKPAGEAVAPVLLRGALYPFIWGCVYCAPQSYSPEPEGYSSAVIRLSDTLTVRRKLPPSHLASVGRSVAFTPGAALTRCSRSSRNHCGTSQCIALSPDD